MLHVTCKIKNDMSSTLSPLAKIIKFVLRNTDIKLLKTYLNPTFSNTIPQSLNI